jgi:predicted O-methyltransferase YrrM
VLARPGLLAVDNVLSHADEVADFRALVAADARVTASLVPIGAGVLLVAPTPVTRA